MKVGWLEADWPAPPDVRAGTTFRTGGVSVAPYASLNLAMHVHDDADAVRQNRERLQSDCELPAAPLWLRQVHGQNVVVDPAPGALTEADAAISRRGQVCAVLTADCLPVVFAAIVGDEVAVAHAGWRGLVGGILERTVAALTTPSAQLVAWLGPAISQSSYEVGGEVRQQFIAADPGAADCFAENASGRWQADLYALARQRLSSLGVNEVFGGDRCTYREADRWFSFRRDGECGRMATFVFRNNA